MEQLELGHSYEFFASTKEWVPCRLVDTFYKLGTREILHKVEWYEGRSLHGIVIEEHRLKCKEPW